MGDVWVGVLVLVLIAAVVRWRTALGRPDLQLLSVVFGGLAGYMLVFFGTRHEINWHLLTAADRTVLHVAPVAVLGLCRYLGLAFKRPALAAPAC